MSGRIVSHVMHPAALADDCRRAAILITPLPVVETCSGPDVIIDAQTLWEKGAHIVSIGSGGLRVKNVADDRGKRPWVIPRHRREMITPTADAPTIAGKPAREMEDVPGLKAVGALGQ